MGRGVGRGGGGVGRGGVGVGCGGTGSDGVGAVEASSVISSSDGLSAAAAWTVSVSEMIDTGTDVTSVLGSSCGGWIIAKAISAMTPPCRIRDPMIAGLGRAKT